MLSADNRWCGGEMEMEMEIEIVLQLGLEMDIEIERKTHHVENLYSCSLRLAVLPKL